MSPPIEFLEPEAASLWKLLRTRNLRRELLAPVPWETWR